MSEIRYWVGNTGRYDQTEHWSLTSGGAGGASVPDGPDYEAIIDENSFTLPGQYISFPIAAYFELTVPVPTLEAPVTSIIHETPVANQQNWYIDGVLFEGTVVTVGAGKDYETIAGAVAGTDEAGDCLFLLDEGSYDNLAVSWSGAERTLYVKAIGRLAYTIINSGVFQSCVAINKPFIYIEGVTLHCNDTDTACVSLSDNDRISLNKCVIKADDESVNLPGVFYGYQITSGTYFSVINCEVQGPRQFLYTDISSGDEYPLPQSSIVKCIIPDPTITNGVGTLFIDDSVTEATEGYGPDYGEDLITTGLFLTIPVPTLEAPVTRNFNYLGICTVTCPAEVTVVTLEAHGLSDNDCVKFISASGVIANEIANGYEYYADVIDVDTFNLMVVPSGELMDTTGTQTATNIKLYKLV